MTRQTPVNAAIVPESGTAAGTVTSALATAQRRSRASVDASARRRHTSLGKGALLACAAALVLTAASSVYPSAPAGAATPQVIHTKVNVFLPGIDVCGFTVNSVVQGTDTFEIFTDRSGNVSIQDLSHVVSTLTNTANGKVVHVEGAGRDAWQPDPVVNRDGTITATDTLTGMDQRIYTSHSSTLVKDAGFLSMTTTFDDQFNVVSQQVIVHGPHQFAGDFTVMCDAIASAIG